MCWWALFQVSFRPQKEVKAKLGDGQTIRSGPFFATFGTVLFWGLKFTYYWLSNLGFPLYAADREAIYVRLGFNAYALDSPLFTAWLLDRVHFYVKVRRLSTIACKGEFCRGVTAQIKGSGPDNQAGE